MKKTSVIVVLSALVLVLSVYFALSTNSSHPTCGMIQRGGECYSYAPSTPCEGGSLKCEDQVCGTWFMTCPQTTPKFRLVKEYYGSVNPNAEVGLTEKEMDEVICYNTYLCNLICDMGKDGKGHCSTVYEEDETTPVIFPASPATSFTLSGAPCEDTHSSD